MAAHQTGLLSPRAFVGVSSPPVLRLLSAPCAVARGAGWSTTQTRKRFCTVNNLAPEQVIVDTHPILVYGVRMSRRSDDPDQQAVYYAERVAFEDTLYAEPLHSDDFMRLADRLFTHDWWERHNVPIPIIEPTTSKDSTSYAWLHYDRPEKDPVIRIAPTDINPWTLAHEAAHVAQYHFYTPGHHGDIESHGREFRATYLSVAEIVLGREAADRLRDNFTQFVPVRPQHAPGKPGSIMTVPRPTTGTGLFPSWRLEQQRDAMMRLQQSPTVSSATRINGAIAL